MGKVVKQKKNAYICSVFYIERNSSKIMTNEVRTKRGIVTDSKSVSFSYRSPIGVRKVVMSHATIAQRASESYARIVNGKK